jgi:sarcosine oxidase
VIVIISAGVCGLAAAYELSRRGQRAIVLERGKPFAEQSAGLARIDFETYRGLASAPVAGQQTDRELGGVKRVPVKPPFHHRRRPMSPSFW